MGEQFGMISRAYNALVEKAKTTIEDNDVFGTDNKSYAAAAVAVVGLTPKAAFMAAVPVVAYLAADAYTAYRIAHAGAEKQSDIWTVGPISALTRKAKYGEYWGDVNHCPMCDMK